MPFAGAPNPKYLAMWGDGMGLDESVLFWDDADLNEFVSEQTPIEEVDSPSYIYDFASHTWNTIEFPKPRLAPVK